MSRQWELLPEVQIFARFTVIDTEEECWIDRATAEIVSTATFISTTVIGNVQFSIAQYVVVFSNIQGSYRGWEIGIPEPNGRGEKSKGLGKLYSAGQTEIRMRGGIKRASVKMGSLYI